MRVRTADRAPVVKVGRGEQLPGGVRVEDAVCSTGAVEPHDARPTLERGEHEHDPAVVAQVRDGLDAAAEQVDVGDLGGSEHLQQPGAALRRDVDVPTRPRRRGADEPDWLRLEPGGQLVVDVLRDDPHGGPPRSWASGSASGNRRRCAAAPRRRWAALRSVVSRRAARRRRRRGRRARTGRSSSVTSVVTSWTSPPATARSDRHSGCASRDARQVSGSPSARGRASRRITSGSMSSSRS